MGKEERYLKLINGGMNMDDWKRNCENSYLLTFKSYDDSIKLMRVFSNLYHEKDLDEIPLEALAEKANLKTNPANKEIIYFHKCSHDGIFYSISSRSASHPTPTTIRLIVEAICGKDIFSMTYWTENKETGVCASDDPSVIDHHWVINSAIDSIRKDACPATDEELVEWIHKQFDGHFDWETDPRKMIYLTDYHDKFHWWQFLYYNYVEADMWGR